MLEQKLFTEDMFISVCPYACYKWVRTERKPIGRQSEVGIKNTSHS